MHVKEKSGWCFYASTQTQIKNMEKLNSFLKPTARKIIFTIIMLAIFWGGGLLYSYTFTFSENAEPQQHNVILIMINNIGNIIYYPVGLVINSMISVIDIKNYQEKFLLFWIIVFIKELLIILEFYLLSCIVYHFKKDKEQAG